jgi:membrane protease subunit (stomatin/prohibitin family)
MAFWNLKAELIDIIEFLDETRDTISYRFERHDNEIKNGAKLIVRPGQVAIFINEGQVADVFSSGTYTLETNNLPILSTLKGWKYGFDSPFKAEVYFISTRQFADLKWGTRSPFMYASKYFTLEMRAFGMFTLQVAEPKTFYENIVSTVQTLKITDLHEKLRSKIVTEVADAVNETELPLPKMMAKISDISDEILKRIQPAYLSKFGVEITDFNVENFNVKDEDMAQYKEFEQNDTIDMSKYQQRTMSDSLKAAASNPNGGSASEGIGLGMGFGMANQMGQMFTNQNQQNQNPKTSSPPAIPTAIQFHAVINGVQAGPFTIEQIKHMISQNQFSKETLIWKDGMANWQQAIEVAETKTLFGSVPPPIPGV